MSHLCRFPFQLKPGLLETNIRMNFGEDYLNPENSVSFYRSISFQHNDALTFINSTIALKVQNKPFDNKKIYVGFRILYIWSWLKNDNTLLRIFKLFKYFLMYFQHSRRNIDMKIGSDFFTDRRHKLDTGFIFQLVSGKCLIYSSSVS